MQTPKEVAIEALERATSFLLIVPSGEGAKYFFPVKDEDDFLTLREAAYQLSLTFNPFQGISGENAIDGKKIDSTYHENGDAGKEIEGGPTGTSRF